MRLEVTRKSDLAVRALCALDCHGRLKGARIAELIGSTRGFTSQVMAPLVEAGWVRSEPGPTGGYQLDTTLDALSFLEVIETIEGPIDNGTCALRGGPCPTDLPCGLHEAWLPAKEALIERLRYTPLTRACSEEAA